MKTAPSQVQRAATALAPAHLSSVISYQHANQFQRVCYRTSVTAAAATADAPAEQEQESKKKRALYPFTGIVGQEQLKLALILNVIDPKIGGVLIMGERGTGKSTCVRALLDILPNIEIVANDPFNSDPTDTSWSVALTQAKTTGELPVESVKVPLVDLPLGATEDRVCGTLDIEKALTEGTKAFSPGLLAKANRGILYVDEVNLLDDHLVDILLDSAASGWNTVEREGISMSHPAQFILVGSGNPEEGELRPQLLDRFGMHAEIKTEKDPELRVQIVEKRAAFDTNPSTFMVDYTDAQTALTDKIMAAKSILPKVVLSREQQVKISEICSEADVDGLRGDLTLNRAAKALASFKGQSEVTDDDIKVVAPLCLRHRLRKDPLEQIDSGDKVNQLVDQVFVE